MRKTNLTATKRNLLALVEHIASPETLAELQTATEEDGETLTTDAIISIDERVEWFMDLYYTYKQEYMIVSDIKTGNFALIREQEDENGDNIEYLDAWNGGSVEGWEHFLKAKEA